MLYLLFSLAGILIIVFLNQWLGTWRPVPEMSAEDTMAILSDQHAGIECSDVALSKDSRMAIARLADGRFGLVRAMADNYVTRLIDAGTIASVRLHAEPYLTIRFRDLSLPPTQLRFKDSQSAARWQSYFAQTPQGTHNG